MINEQKPINTNVQGECGAYLNGTCEEADGSLVLLLQGEAVAGGAPHLRRVASVVQQVLRQTHKHTPVRRVQRRSSGSCDKTYTGQTRTETIKQGLAVNAQQVRMRT